MTEWQIGGTDPAKRLMGQISLYSKTAPVPTPEQVAAVLHALADYTAIVQAVNHSRDTDDPHPEAISVVRWLHKYGDNLEGRVK